MIDSSKSFSYDVTQSPFVTEVDVRNWFNTVGKDTKNLEEFSHALFAGHFSNISAKSDDTKSSNSRLDEISIENLVPTFESLERRAQYNKLKAMAVLSAMQLRAPGLSTFGLSDILLEIQENIDKIAIRRRETIAIEQSIVIV
jgi:hypothetical protein